MRLKITEKGFSSKKYLDGTKNKLLLLEIYL